MSDAPSTSLEVRGRIVDALKLDLVGPLAGDALREGVPAWLGPPIELVSDRVPDPSGHAPREEFRPGRGR